MTSVKARKLLLTSLVVIAVILNLSVQLVLSLFAAFYAYLTSDQWLDEKTHEEIDIINAESNLGFELYGINPKGFETRIYTEDKLVEGHCVDASFLPHGEKDIVYLLTEITIKGGDYDLFGFRVGDDFKTADFILDNKSYKRRRLPEGIYGAPEDFVPPNHQYEFKKHYVYIYIDETGGKVSQMRIQIDINKLLNWL